MTRPFWHRASKHQHHWTTVAERFQPGSAQWEVTPARYRGAGALDVMQKQMDLMERMAFGMTTVSQRCDGCGEQRAYTATGDARTKEGG